jgi:hypothetical protein
VGAKDQLKQSLDDMQKYFTPNMGVYDPAYYKNLTECMGKYDDDLLLKSQNGAWKGMIDYSLSNGTSSDYQNRTDYWG